MFSISGFSKEERQRVRITGHGFLYCGLAMGEVETFQGGGL